MMDRETLDRFVRVLLADIPLAPDDWAAVAAQAEQVFALVATLDELPLDAIEPAAIYKVIP